MRKGILELCILNSLAEEPLYGYDIVRSLRKIDSLVITEGTIYPLLSRLKREGLLESSIEESPDGPPRKYYRLSKYGRQRLAQMNQYWAQLRVGVEGLMEGGFSE